MAKSDIYLAAGLLCLASALSSGCSCTPDPPPPAPARHDCGVAPSCSPDTRADHGFCVPKCDAKGSLNCPCHPDGTCSIDQDQPLTCLENVCQKARAQAAGALGGPCREVESCDPGLRCVSGECQTPDCASGRLGCPCSAYGSCEEYAGQATRCDHDGVCVVAQCMAVKGEPRPAGATCSTAKDCADDLSCSRGRCLLPTLTLSVTNAAARSCDVVLEGAPGAALGATQFAKDIRGEAYSRAPQLALSLLSETQQAFAGVVARVEYSGAQAPELVRYQCFDDTGALLEQAQLELK